MPEGDTLRRTAAALAAATAGKTLRSIRPESFRRLVGRRVAAVEARGKHLFIRFEPDDGDSLGLALHSHLRMNGSWHVYTVGEGWRKPGWQATAILEFDDTVVVGFRVPVLEIVRGEERVSHLGPDILDQSFDVATSIHRARGASAPTVAELLLDQTTVAGIGNIYRCETLWLRQLDPFVPPPMLSDHDLTEILLTARRLMREALVSPVRRRTAVHGRGGRPCRRCQTKIEVRSLGDPPRFLYWCPRCQTGTGARSSDPGGG